MAIRVAHDGRLIQGNASPTILNNKESRWTTGFRRNSIFRRLTAIIADSQYADLLSTGLRMHRCSD
jgi:hypothetical protein